MTLVLAYQPGKVRGVKPKAVVVARAPFTPETERPAPVTPEKRKRGRPRKSQ